MRIHHGMLKNVDAPILFLSLRAAAISKKVRAVQDTGSGGERGGEADGVRGTGSVRRRRAFLWLRTPVSVQEKSGAQERGGRG